METRGEFIAAFSWRREFDRAELAKSQYPEYKK
jgi:hypothetical protein